MDDIRLHSRTEIESEKPYVNQSTAELPSAFLVNSHASSNATGNIVIVPMPMIAIITNSAPRLWGLTKISRCVQVCFIFMQARRNVPAQIKENQAAAIKGTNILIVIPR
jgi:hypothetical protein